MKKRIFLIISVFIFALSVFIYNNTEASDVRGVTDKSIRIGMLIPMTGPAASLGIHLGNATRNYMRHINEHNGIHGRKIKLILEDDRYSIPPAIAAFKKVVYKDKVFAMIGPGSGSQITVLWKKIQKEKMPTIAIPMPEVAVTPYKRYIFIITDIYPGQMKVLVDYMVNDFFKKKNISVGLVYPDTEVGKIDVVPTIERLKKYNLKPVTKEILNPAAVDASSQVMSLRRYKANCVIHAGTITPTTIALLKGLKKFGLNIPVFASWGAMLGEEMNNIGDAAKKLYSVHATSPWYDEGPGLEAMRKITLQYHPGTEKPYRGTIYTHGWICSTVLVEGLKRAGRNLNEENLINALERIKDYDTGGLCGPINYSSTSHKGGDSWKIYKADPIGKKFAPLTGWRTAD